MGQSTISNKISNKEFQVAILIDDVSAAKTISGALREIGIFAHYYNSLEDLWVSANTQSPDLCLVDVKKMSEGSLKLKDHPKVRSGKLKLAFYYTESTKILLHSTFSTANYGLIRGDISLIDQLRNTLKRVHEEIRLKEQNEALELRLEQLRLRQQQRSTDQESLDSIAKYNLTFRNLAAQFKQVHSTEAFSNKMIQFFSNWDECDAFSVYALNSTKQKLVSIQSTMSGFKVLPDLWLTSPCLEGMGQYAQEMAFEVGHGHLGSDVMPIRISGAFHDPDFLIMASFKQTKLKSISLDNLETRLSSEYRRVCALATSFAKGDVKVMNIYDSLQMMDDEQFNSIESKYRTAVLDMNSLVSLIRQNTTNRFSWKSFHIEFTSELFEMLKGSCKISYYGAEKILIFLDKKFIDTNYQVVKHFASDFQYWRYFEDGSLVVSEDCYPKVKMVPPSALSVLKSTEEMESLPSFLKEPSVSEFESFNNL